MANRVNAKDVLLQVGDGGSPTENFNTIAELKTVNITLNSDTVEVTSKDSGNWRELMTTAAVRSVEVQGTGNLTDDSYANVLWTNYFNENTSNYQILASGTGGVGTFAGAFQITNLSIDSAERGVGTFNVTLSSAGTVTLT